MRLLQAIPIEWFDAFGAGVYLLFAIVHFDLWSRRRERTAHLWLALASVGALSVDLTGMAMREIGSAAPYWIVAVNILAVAVTTSAVAELVAAVSVRRPGAFTRTLEAAVFLLALAYVVWSERVLFVGLMVSVLSLLSLGMLHAASAGRSGDQESATIARGLLALIVVLAFDVLALLGIVPSVPALPILGFVILFIFAARALNERYERQYRELLALRNELEMRVRERTAQLEEANSRLREVSRTDPLTGLPNRRAFLEAAIQELRRAERSQRPFSIVLLDLDHFKRINDTYGHAAGDEVLVTAARVLRASLRGQDVVSRWGGEEFILLLLETDGAGAVHAAETARRAIRETGVEFEGQPIAVTASFGVAHHEPGTTIDATIAAADAALYRAKEEGRDRVVAA